MSRRAFLASAAGVCLSAALPGCSTRPPGREMERRALVRMARLLYPHDTLDDGIYREALRPLLARADSSRPLAASLRAGLESLDAGDAGRWLAATPERQLGALERIAGTPFFRTVQTSVRAELYEHPAVWKLIGYEGSSVEDGGWIHRGFDHIDWLPRV